MANKGKQKTELQIDVRTQEQWDELMAKDGLIVVDAYAAWCGPCKAIVSTFRRLKNEIGDDLLHFATASTDTIESLSLYRGKSRPTFLLYGGGELVFVIRGCNAPLLIKSINHHLELEHKIIEGNAERTQFIDTEIQNVVKEEKKDVEKKKPEEEEEEEIARQMSRRRMRSSSSTVEVPKEVTVAIIKPDAVRAGLVDDILKRMEEAGIEILQQEERVLSKEEAAEFYKQHEGSEHFEQLIEFMSSGPCMTLLLSKKGDGVGYGVIPEFRDLLGPKDVNQAKEEAPESLRAQYGTDAVMNAVHGCDSSESAARELAFFFPNFNVPKVQEKRKKKQIQRTLALIRPHALAKRRESILKKIEESGFVIAMSKEMHLTREQAEDFYSEHKDQDYFESLVNSMTSGPSLALCLAREEAVESWRQMLGPKDVTVAKEEAPDSLRAVFADEETDINPLHGADSTHVAEMEIKKIFPPQSTVAVIKPEVYSVPEQKEEIISKIKESGFSISAQKEINLTKELAAQFYKEHEGKEFFDGLTDYMSSGPTLFLILSREDAVSGFRTLMGPVKPEEAKEVAPESLRAKFASDEMKNAIHGSSSVMKAKAVIEEYFPEVELNPDGTVKEPSLEETREETAGEGGQEEGVSEPNEQIEKQQKKDDETTDVNNNPAEEAIGSHDETIAQEGTGTEESGQETPAQEGNPQEGETTGDPQSESPKPEGSDGETEAASNQENNAKEASSEEEALESNEEQEATESNAVQEATGSNAEQEATESNAVQEPAESNTGQEATESNADQAPDSQETNDSDQEKPVETSEPAQEAAEVKENGTQEGVDNSGEESKDAAAKDHEASTDSAGDSVEPEKKEAEKEEGGEETKPAGENNQSEEGSAEAEKDTSS